MSKVLPSMQEWLQTKRSAPLNQRQKKTLARLNRKATKRAANKRANKLKSDQRMRYTPKELATYRRALRFGRSMKADGKFRAAPGLKFDGGRLAVSRDSKGNVHIRANSKMKNGVRSLGPRGVKDELNIGSLAIYDLLSPSQAKAVGAKSERLLAIVGKGTYKKGSTGSRGG